MWAESLANGIALGNTRDDIFDGHLAARPFSNSQREERVAPDSTLPSPLTLSKGYSPDIVRCHPHPRREPLPSNPPTGIPHRHGQPPTSDVEPAPPSSPIFLRCRRDGRGREEVKHQHPGGDERGHPTSTSMASYSTMNAKIGHDGHEHNGRKCKSPAQSSLKHDEDGHGEQEASEWCRSSSNTCCFTARHLLPVLYDRRVLPLSNTTRRALARRRGKRERDSDRSNRSMTRRAGGGTGHNEQGGRYEGAEEDLFEHGPNTGARSVGPAAPLLECGVCRCPTTDDLDQSENSKDRAWGEHALGGHKHGDGRKHEHGDASCGGETGVLTSESPYLTLLFASFHPSSHTTSASETSPRLTSTHAHPFQPTTNKSDGRRANE
ncbi:unnamed protein product [Cyclocybe aegerita]|uniref:Uncharacterized protein n=1 Tax=Cyclocybe aegerita TaxID=1973307 RepID=A0A8S0VSH1_CYCAE|nr:unnamed protein product [Cyclocybe aegerita]